MHNSVIYVVLCSPGQVDFAKIESFIADHKGGVHEALFPPLQLSDVVWDNQIESQCIISFPDPLECPHPLPFQGRPDLS